MYVGNTLIRLHDTEIFTFWSGFFTLSYRSTEKMDTIKIDKLRQLLKRFYAADTAPEEEKSLREMLSDPDLPEEFLPDRKMMKSMSILLPSEDFEERISMRIDSFAQEEAVKSKKPVRIHWPTLLRWSAAAAAVVIIAVMSIIRLSTPIPAQEEMSPEEVYEQTAMAFMIFAEALDKGYAAIEMADSTTLDASAKAMDAIFSIKQP